MSTVLGAIADDFTGATDLAGIIARSGVAVNLHIGIPEAQPAGNKKSSAPFEIIALKSRTAPTDEAVQETLAALEWLKESGATRFFWKYCSTFDSTAEGNIGPVAEAILNDLSSGQTIYCPAFPENGRSIYMGNLFVGEQLLHESPMKDHPLTPMRDSNLGRLLEPQVTRAVAQITLPDVRLGADHVQTELKKLENQGVSHVVLDAVDGSDLETITRATQDMQLLTGGSALALHLPSLYAELGLLDVAAAQFEQPQTGAGQLVLSGSCSSMTQQQVEHYRTIADSFRLDPLELASSQEYLNNAISWLQNLPVEKPKIIFATANPESVANAQSQLGREKAGELIEQALAALASEALSLGIRRFVVAGGETSGAVTQTLGVTRLSIGEEISPGVPWTFSETKGENIALALKSGNFGAVDFFETALNAL